jgi:class 3 adenylate cyclase
MEGVAPTEPPKLAAILAIDTVGYSRLMREDEVQTLSDLKAVRTEVIDPTVVAYNGRLFKAMGDGFLLEFGSVGNAVQCAIDIRQKMLARDASCGDGQTLEFRMGLNVADIIPDQDDVYGDGVNIAVRLEALAEPSEICISGAVYEQIRHTFGDVFKRLGPKKLKNIDLPIEVYSAPVGAREKPPFLNRFIRLRRARQSIVVACATVLLVAGVSVLFVTEFEWSFSFDGKSAVAGAKHGSTSASDAAKADDQAEVARIAAGAETEAAKAKAEAVKAKAKAEAGAETEAAEAKAEAVKAKAKAEAGAETEAAEAKADAIKAKAKAEADTVTAEAQAKAQVVKSAVDVWKEASLSLTAATEALSEAEAKLAELKGRAVALKEAGPEATNNKDNARHLDALAPRIRDAEEDLGRILVRYEAAVKGEQRAKAHMEKIKADAQSSDD